MNLPKIISEKIIEVLYPKISEFSDNALKELESQRGGSYSPAYKHKKRDYVENLLKIAVAQKASEAWAIIKVDLQIPHEPVELKQYETACNHYAVQIYRHRIEPDEPGPKMPVPVINYQREISERVKRFCELAKRFHLYWDEHFLDLEVKRIIAEVQVKRTSSEIKKKPFRGTAVSKTSSLVGDFVFQNSEQVSLLP